MRTSHPFEIGLSSGLEKVQRRAAQIVTRKLNFDINVTELLNTLGWKSLKSRRIEQRRNLFLRFSGPEFPRKVQNIIRNQRNDRSTGAHSSRKDNEIFARTVMYYWSFFPDAIRTANREVIYILEWCNSTPFHMLLADCRVSM